MSRRFINQLGDSETIEETFVASEKQLRPNRNGNLYLQLRLADRSGTVNAMMWNSGERAYRSFENGDYVLVSGTTQVYNGKLQIILNEISRADPSEVDPDDFQRLDMVQVDKLTLRLSEMLRGMKDVHLRNLAECFLSDEDFMDRFSQHAARPDTQVRRARYVSGSVGLAVILLSSVVGMVPGNVLEVAFKVVNLLVAPLFGLFFMALFVSWATSFGTFVGAACGLATVVAINYWSLFFTGPGLSFIWGTPVGLFVQVLAGSLASLLPIGTSHPLISPNSPPATGEPA